MPLDKIIFTKKSLIISSFLFLLFPCLVFLFFWVKLPIAILSTIALFPVFYYLKNNFPQESLGLTVVEITQLSTIAVVIVLLSGVGSFSEQIRDYIGHTTKLNDLIVHPWPFQYKNAGQYPCYYFGYYLVPALITKLFSTSVASVIWVIWASIGMFLSLALTYLLVQKKIVIVLAAFVCSGGYAMAFFLNQKTIVSPYLISPSPEKLYYVAYAAFDNTLWVPNQIIPSILSIVILLLCVELKNYVVPACILACSFFWAPFPSLISSLLYLYFIITSLKHFLTVLKQSIVPFIGLVVAFIPIAIYLSGTSSSVVSTFIWNIEDQWLPIVFIYIFVEIGFVTLLFYALTRFKASATTPLNTYFYLGIIIFCGLCLLKYGVWNDLMARGVIPIMYLFSLVIVYQLYYELNKTRKIILATCWLVLSVFPIKNIYHQITHNQLLVTPKIYTPKEDMYDVLVKYYSMPEAQQYLLKKNSAFEKYLLKK